MDSIEIILRLTNMLEEDITKILEKEASCLAESIKQKIPACGLRITSDRLVNSVKYKMNGPLEAEVYIDESIAPYFQYIEEDTEQHDIVAKNGGSLAFRWGKAKSLGIKETQDGKVLFRKVHHPGTTGKHPFGKTLEENRQGIIQRVKSLVEVESVPFENSEEEE